MNRGYLITGCSGGGKSTLIRLLEARDHTIVREPGMRIIQGGGPAPWDDTDKFLSAAISLSRNDLAEHNGTQRPVFFDRGLFDALSGMADLRKVPLASVMHDFKLGELPYCAPVFFAPPWPEIFEQTPERPHSYQSAVDEADRLRADLAKLSVETLDLPKVSPEQRLQFVLNAIA